MSSSVTSVIHKPNKMRIMAIGLGLLIAVPLFGFAYFNAQNFFARASDEVPRDVTISKITRGGAHVVWVTDKSTQGVVEYGLTANELNLFAPELEARREHEVELTLLTPATTYYFHIRVGNTVYDNAGVPWVFTTRTESGDEAEEEVKGISIRLTQAVQKTSPTVTPTPIVCSKMTCTEVKSYLGRGCTTQDLQKCNLTKNDTSTYASPTSGIYFTPNPSPTSIIIDSESCNLKRLYPINNCIEWQWTGIDFGGGETCIKAFNRYLFQCQDVPFDKDLNSDNFYFTDTIYNASSTTYTIPITPQSGEKLEPGEKVYCRVRAVDIHGQYDSDSHGTPWIEYSQGQVCK